MHVFVVLRGEWIWGIFSTPKKGRKAIKAAKDSVPDLSMAVYEVDWRKPKNIRSAGKGRKV